MLGCLGFILIVFVPGGIFYYMCLGGSKSRWYFLTVVFFNLADSVAALTKIINVAKKKYNCINEYNSPTTIFALPWHGSPGLLEPS